MRYATYCRRLIWMAFMLLALSVSSPVFAAKRVALVIGNGGYSSSPLRNPVNDAKALGDALRNLGFSVSRESDAGRRSMVEALRLFGRESAGADVALFFTQATACKWTASTTKVASVLRTTERRF